MPNLPTHLSLASRVASTIAHPTIDRHLGSFLLGSTSPDIRIMTKWSRDQTHFAPLEVERIGTGVDGLLEAHPDLANSSCLDDKTTVFLSGYFTHLVADETWILEMYQPYFDGDHLFANQIEANLWDRALQIGMDIEARVELAGMEQVRTHLDGSELGVEVAFIGAETLTKWREWVTEFTTWEFTWERLRFASRRLYKDSEEATQLVDTFLESVPDSLERLHSKIPEDTIVAYREKAISESVRVIKEYLGVPESNQGVGGS